MPTKITRAVLEGFVHCALKGHLKSAGEAGTASAFEEMLLARQAKARLELDAKLLGAPRTKLIVRGIPLSLETLKQGAWLILDATFDDDRFSFHFDGLQRVDGQSKLGSFHYVPVLVHDSRQIRKEQKLLLALHGLVLSQLQRKRPEFGLVVHGQEAEPRKVRLDRYSAEADQIVLSLQQVMSGEVEPRFNLNPHCKVCEFRQRCHTQAIKIDHLSLLRGIGEREIKRYARKGIFTVTQLSHTFRPRRKGKRGEPQSPKRQYALHAKAIRDRTIYVLGAPKLPSSPVQIYLDIEANPEESYVYLIGMLICQNGVERKHSFWADTKDQEQKIFKRFLATLAEYQEFALYAYGNYESRFLRRMRTVSPETERIDRALASVVNILAVIYPHVYFPTWSNGLKDVAACLGHVWATPDASGLQSIVWRERWTETHDGALKQMLIQYNQDDCMALRVVTDCIRAIVSGADVQLPVVGDERVPLTRVEELDELSRRRKWGAINFVHKDFAYVNGCAYFNYQRQRIFARTIKSVKRKPTSLRKRNRQLRVTRRIATVASKCEVCGSDKLVALERHPHTWRRPRIKRAFDLTATAHGVKLSVIESYSANYRCRKCGTVFVPRQHSRMARYAHGLQGWAIYQHVAHGLSFGAVREMIDAVFDVPIERSYVNHFKTFMASFYEPTRQRLLEKLLAGPLLHVDETLVKLRGRRGYVWALTNLEEVVYLYRPSREGDFLKELLKSFRGVLVSDFYAVYDAIDCPQQKCLVHLMRDMNDDLLANPFDSELRSLTEPFGELLKAIVECIDRYGLKRLRLRAFRRQIADYFQGVESLPPKSDPAQALRSRLLKYRDKLFTFVNYDGVPWNNNNAENAIHRFALYRARVPNMMNEAGLTKYLVLLSVCHTCYYKGLNFWRFLLSRCRDFDAYVQSKAARRPPMVIDTYPEGYLTEFEKLVQRQKSKKAAEPGQRH